MLDRVIQKTKMFQVFLRHSVSSPTSSAPVESVFSYGKSPPDRIARDLAMIMLPALIYISNAMRIMIKRNTL